MQVSSRAMSRDLADKPATPIVDLHSLQDALRSFSAAREWEKFHTPKNLAMAISGEAGELLEVFQWLTDEQSVTLADSETDRTSIGHELADILIYVARLADVLDIDLDEAVGTKLHINEARYPIHLSKGNSIKYNRRTERPIDDDRRPGTSEAPVLPKSP